MSCVWFFSRKDGDRERGRALVRGTTIDSSLHSMQSSTNLKQLSREKKILLGVSLPTFNFYFLYFFFKLLAAYMENTANGEKRIKIEHISFNNGTTLVFLLIFSLYVR